MRACPRHQDRILPGRRTSTWNVFLDAILSFCAFPLLMKGCFLATGACLDFNESPENALCRCKVAAIIVGHRIYIKDVQLILIMSEWACPSSNMSPPPSRATPASRRSNPSF